MREGLINNQFCTGITVALQLIRKDDNVMWVRHEVEELRDKIKHPAGTMSTETSRQYRSLAIGLVAILGIGAIAIFRFSCRS